jgi:hypothetical protein
MSKPSMTKGIFEGIREKEEKHGSIKEDSELQMYATEPPGAMDDMGAGGPPIGAPAGGEPPVEAPEDAEKLESAARVACEVMAELGAGDIDPVAGYDELADEQKERCREIARKFIAVLEPEESPEESPEEFPQDTPEAGDEVPVGEKCVPGARAKKAAGKTYSKEEEPEKYFGTATKVQKAISKKK